MDITNLTLPENVAQPTETAVETFEKWIWYNSELCNNCFSRVRAIGDVIHIQSANGTFTYDINDFYERTDNASQEHDPYSNPTDRYGQCYCLECGSDTSATDRTLSLEDTKERCKRLCAYIAEFTPLDIDPKRVGHTIVRLRDIRDNHGYDSEIIAVSIATGIHNDPGQD